MTYAEYDAYIQSIDDSGTIELVNDNKSIQSCKGVIDVKHYVM